MTGSSQMQPQIISRYSSRLVGENTTNLARKQVLVAIMLLMIFIRTSSGATNNNSSSSQVQGKIAEFDRVIQGYAFKAFRHPKTGMVVNVTVPSSMQGVLEVQAVRLRSGSLKRRGFMFNNEFNIPEGSGVAKQAPVRVVLVSRKFNTKLYSPEGYTIVSPVVGIRVYDAGNLSTENILPELDFVAGARNITVRIPLSLSGINPLCASFDVTGGMSLSKLSSSPSFCSSNRLADFALVVPASTILSPPSPAPSNAVPGSIPSRKKKSRRWKIILGVVLGAFGGVLLLGLLVLAVLRLGQRRKISNMERRADRGEVLQSSLVRSSRAPTAGATRTKPVLEGDYAA